MSPSLNESRKIGVMPIGIVLTLIIGGLLAFNLFGGDRTFFLGGDTSHGHYQIELECNACHVKAFSGKDAMQTQCESCHAKELDKFNDSHPKSVFTDPRNAELLEALDARYCVTCHREHKPEITRDAGVTLAQDFCFHCHQEVGTNRESHKDFEFKTCATSGCHNFHDNSMLYEKFLIKHMDEPALKNTARLPARTGLKRWLKKNKRQQPLEVEVAELASFSPAPDTAAQSIVSATQDWTQSIHAKVGANCSQCHGASDSTHPLIPPQQELEACGSCHKRQKTSFVEGRHGMRMAVDLPAMSTSDARLNVSPDEHQALSCSSCHQPHSLDIQTAAVDACLGCHKDQHSQAYSQSKHSQLWRGELVGELAPGAGVSCASCHLPRIKKGKRVTVEHNQNLYLRPNIKMLRKVCMNCHGMEFSVAALSDEALIQNNFQGTPDMNHQTFELIKQRILQKQHRN